MNRGAAAYWIARSSRAMTARVGWERGASCHSLRLTEPLPHAGIGVGILGDVADHRDRIRARRKNLRGVLELDAADRDQRDGADALLPLRDLRNALRFEAHRLQGGEEDRAQRDI